MAKTSSNSKKNTKKSSSRKPKPMTQLGCVILICCALYGFFLVFKESYTTFVLTDKLDAVQKEYLIVEEENERLTAQRDKLRDPDYVETYARGTYMLTKEGESIFYLPGSDEE